MSARGEVPPVLSPLTNGVFRWRQPLSVKSFCRAVGDVTMQDVGAAKIAAFLAGTGPITRFWERKHSVLSR